MKKHTLSMNGDGTLNSKNAAAAAHGSGAARGVSFSVSGIGGVLRRPFEAAGTCCTCPDECVA